VEMSFNILNVSSEQKSVPELLSKNRCDIYKFRSVTFDIHVVRE